MQMEGESSVFRDISALRPPGAGGRWVHIPVSQEPLLPTLSFLRKCSPLLAASMLQIRTLRGVSGDPFVPGGAPGPRYVLVARAVLTFVPGTGDCLGSPCPFRATAHSCTESAFLLLGPGSRQ